MDDDHSANIPVKQLYDWTSQRAFWHRLWRKVKGGCNDLLPAHRVLSRLDLADNEDLGLQDVSLDRIIGSSGRDREFDLTFRPRRRDGESRWLRVAHGRNEGKSLPPVLLFKVRDVYFVEDGHHRISVARARGEKRIQARVIALNPAPLTPDHTCTRLGYKVETPRRDVSTREK